MKIVGTKQGNIFTSLKLVTSHSEKSLEGFHAINRDILLESVDLTGDGQKEVVIETTTGTGTGIQDKHIQVLNKDLAFIHVEDPTPHLLSHTSVAKTDHNIAIQVNDHKVEIPLESLGIQEDHLFEKPVFGNITYYDIDDNHHLKVTKAIQVSPAGFIGDFTVTYKFENDYLKADEIRLNLDE
ncbi:hypothetical protein [Caldalkalibacillus salinus]|uniref:hypothetical protein n=1 Tax=Caldalkalibacillus salinus TaxID=2803787 RepID=UPI001923B4AD|nr:hypothetical protein [Caldalkalibacillus salinus]